MSHPPLWPLAHDLSHLCAPRTSMPSWSVSLRACLMPTTQKWLKAEHATLPFFFFFGNYIESLDNTWRIVKLLAVQMTGCLRKFTVQLNTIKSLLWCFGQDLNEERWKAAGVIDQSEQAVGLKEQKELLLTSVIITCQGHTAYHF